MNLIIKLNCAAVNKNFLQTLAAFDANGKCRGAIKFKYLDDLKTSLAFLSVAGIGAESLSFKLYDETLKKTFDLSDKITYTPNTIVGNVQSPYTLKISDDACNTLSIASNSPTDDYYINVFPNEIKNDVQIEIGGKVNDVVRFELFDIQGKSIVQFEKAKNQLNHKFTLNSMYTNLNDLAGGVYLLKVEINGQDQSFKLVK